MDEDIQLLRVLSDTATNIFLSKKSNIARINSINMLDSEKEKWIDSIISPLDNSLKILGKDIYNILIKIPIFNYFLSQQNGVNIFDSAQLISLVVDINNFQDLNNLYSYAGFVPNSKNYNKKLHKLLLKIGYKLIQNNEQYEWIYHTYIDRYREKNPFYSQKHIENMAKRIVIKKFLKNLYISWNAINKEFE